MPCANCRGAGEKKFDVLAGKLAERFASDVMKNSDASLSTALQQAGFTVPFKMTAEMNNALQATITENVNLIRSIPQQYLTQVETLVMQSVSRGRDLGTLTKSCNSAMASPGAGRLLSRWIRTTRQRLPCSRRASVRLASAAGAGAIPTQGKSRAPPM